MKYYLETNSICSLSFERINTEYRFSGYTSYLAILEIISGINTKSYKRRQRDLQKIRKTKIRIDLRMPQQILAQSFKINYNYDTRTKPLLNTMDLICDIDDYEKAYEISNRNRKYWSIKSLTTADKQVCYPEIDYITRLQTKIKEELKQNEREELVNLLNKDICSLNEIEKDKLYYIVNNATKIEMIENAKKCIELFQYNFASIPNLDLLLKNYNHWADKYYQVHSYRVIRDIVLNNSPGINDFYDTSHLLYLNSDDQKIMTNDAKLFNDVNAMFNETALKM